MDDHGVEPAAVAGRVDGPPRDAGVGVLDGVDVAGEPQDFAGATIATQIFVLPLLLYQMGQLSLVSLPANLLILPVIPWTMLFGFFAGGYGDTGDIFNNNSVFAAKMRGITGRFLAL